MSHSDLRPGLRDALFAAGPACGPETAELFTGPDGEAEQLRLAREAEAKAICRRCPAWFECLALALAERPSAGVWAGLTAHELHGLGRLAASSAEVA